MIQDASKGSLGLTIVVLGLLAGAATLPWLEYEHSSGRNTSPDGPYGEETLVDYKFHTMGALPSSGDLSPEDEATWQQAILFTLGGAGLLMILAAFGELPGLHRIMHRNVSLAFQATAWFGVAGSLTIGWFYLPNTLSAYGVSHPFTYFLVEPDGYTRTTLSYGWILAGLAFLGIPMAWIQKFQAGSDDPADLEVYRV